MPTAEYMRDRARAAKLARAAETGDLRTLGDQRMLKNRILGPVAPYTREDVESFYAVLATKLTELLRAEAAADPDLVHKYGLVMNDLVAGQAKVLVVRPGGRMHQLTVTQSVEGDPAAVAELVAGARGARPAPLALGEGLQDGEASSEDGAQDGAQGPEDDASDGAQDDDAWGGEDGQGGAQDDGEGPDDAQGGAQGPRGGYEDLLGGGGGDGR